MNEDADKLVNLRVDLDHRIHFAMQQNDVPIVKALRIENQTDAPLRDLEVRIAVEPSFALGWGTRIAEVGSEAVYNLDAHTTSTRLTSNRSLADRPLLPA